MRKRSTRKLLTCFAAAILLCLSASPCPAENIIYTYDDLNRLEQAIYPNGTIIKYSYDNVGNRLEQRINSIDLVVTAVSGPSEAYLTQVGTVTTTVRNQGASTSGQFYVGIFLSSDSVITTDDRLLGYAYVGDLGPGAEVNQNTSVTIPAETVTGPYYLGAIADYTGALPESNRANNVLAGNPITIRLPILSILKSGTGSGTVATVPANLSCGATCSGYYYLGSEVTLTAAPDTGSFFGGWSGGGCSGVDNCDVVVNSDLNIGASFSAYTAVTVLAPNGGEVMPSGSSHTIRWGAPSAAVNFKLSYTLDGTRYTTIANGVTGTSYNWTVPKPSANSPLCKVNVVGLDSSNKSVGEDISDGNFTIEVVRLTSPNGGGGQTLQIGSVVPITWITNATSKTVNKVILSYSTNGGGSWTTITTINSSNPGTYNWTVPNTPGGTCMVKVALYNNNTSVGGDTSDSTFTIAP